MFIPCLPCILQACHEPGQRHAFLPEHLAHSTYSINTCSIKLNHIAPTSISVSNVPFFYLDRLLAKCPVFLYLGKCPASSCPEAINGGFPGARTLLFPPGPEGRHSWWKARPGKLRACGGSQSGGLDQVLWIPVPLLIPSVLALAA